MDLGLIDDSLPQIGSLEYKKYKLKSLMEEDCMSMRNDPIDPLETVDDMEFNLLNEGNTSAAND